MKRVMARPTPFDVLQNGKPRLGRVSLVGRKPIDTPNYIANTSRGCVPHLTQDTLTKSTSIHGVYAALEDFLERAPDEPIFKYAESLQSGLRQFLAVPDDKVLILGVRRSPPVAPPPATSNTDAAVAVSTSVGFRYLEAEEYARRVDLLRPDILIGMADIPVGRSLVPKRVEKATDRSLDWINMHITKRSSTSSEAALFVPLLPISCANQQYYIDYLVDQLSSVHGLVLHSLDPLVDLPGVLDRLPRLDLTEAGTPVQVLQHIERGVDLLVLPFIDTVTDAGVAFTFIFGRPATSQEVQPLGVDMWGDSHAVDLAPLVSGCTCYACAKHHRAYIQHLLNAKEMLGWVLLGIHNHHMMELFFQAIQKSIRENTFDADVEVFQRAYEPQFPAKTGQGPRVRGYQRRSEKPSEPKVNPPAFVKYKSQNVPPRKPAAPTTPKTSGLPDDLDMLLPTDE